eukprot:CAMPEP_0177609200 /NCGR_PEP_ID=MMETSP0419_2-20121207/18934_1 /TAXON_ID=582737 /ORGANISM="Tetraselmis sp., Strain GSL018" /LENGTH=128 /DNA_ID=CAMNT_0019104053 /DNA_START=348 /DNA_END=735 /DNA_ORIENTATION=+
MTGLKAELLDSDPEEAEYVWVKKHSEESGRDYYVNQETGESTWERPVDLAWRLVKRPVDDPYAEIEGHSPAAAAAWAAAPGVGPIPRRCAPCGTRRPPSSYPPPLFPAQMRADPSALCESQRRPSSPT